MYQRPQTNRNNKQLNSVDANSAYFTHIEPPPHGGTTNMGGYQYNNQYGYGGGRYNGAGSVQSSTSPSPTSSFTKPTAYGHAAAPPPPPAAQTQYSADLTKPSRHRPGRANPNTGGGCLSFLGATVLLVVWTAVLAGGGYVWYTQQAVPDLQRETKHWQRKFETMEELNQELELAQSKHQQQQPQQLQQIQELERQLRVSTQQEGGARHQVQQLQQRLQQAQQESRDLERSMQAVQKEGAEQVTKLHKAIQTQSKQLVLQKFGKGPYRVEFEVQFPQDDHPLYFLIELAPLDVMPHTVHLFLEQVTSQLFDNGGFSFHHNGGHILFGSPFPNLLTNSRQDLENRKTMEHSQEYLTRRFHQQGHAQLLFPEYSPDYTHKQYTVAFAGRPGGPDLYINTVDNVQLHGPGGYAQDGLGDACFGKVVTGVDVIQRMHASSKGKLNRDSWLEMEHGPIAVKSAKLLSQKK